MTAQNEHARNEFGHVDDEGNVFLVTPSGPVKIAQYVAGPASEGLEFFTRKYAELTHEAALAIARLSDGKATPESVKPLLERLSAAVDSPSMIGDMSLIPGIRADIEAAIAKRRAEISAIKAAAREKSTARREELVALAEKLATSTQWKPTGDKFKSLLDEWKALPRGERAKEQELWTRFSHARSAFDKARRSYFATLDSTRGEAEAAKKALVRKATDLSTSTDWQSASNTLKGLMADWKKLPRAARAVEDALWAEFKAAQDAFFAARSAVMTQRDEALSGNLEVKLGLLARAEALLPITDAQAAKNTMREIQELWEKAGHVPRNDKDKIERRLKAVEDAIRSLQEDHWRKTKPEVVERANTLVSSFEAQLNKLEEQISSASDAAAATLREQRDHVKALLEAAKDGASKLR